ncbi:MAG: tRNA lysidine(34) synthetase TilS [Caldisericaceae bacterium]|nr:tRNA lysidine(34) synthetase TilS [Caldisericaceae bacterium]
MNLKEKVAEFIDKYGLIKEGERVLAGVSGGPDSVFMTVILNEIGKEKGFDIGIAVFDHKIRPESKKEADFVEKIALKLGLPFFRGEEDVKSYAERKGVSLEEAAREKRLEFLMKVSGQNGFDKIALAHNKDDFAETVLYHIAKGSGLSGLTGIRPKSFGKIIHPILCIERKEIERYLIERKIPFQTDKTNFLLDYSRNRIRHQIIPLLTSINPSFKENIFNMSEIIAEEDRFLEELSFKDAETIKDEKGFSLKLFLSLPLFEQRRIIKRLFGENASFERTERILRFLKDASKRKENFYGNLFILKKGGRFFLEERKEVKFTTESVYRVKIPGETEIPEAGCVLSARISDEFSSHGLGKFKAAFDFDALRFPLFVRFRRAGDRILTEAGTKKLQDLFTDAKIPEEQRAYAPILTDAEDNILWVIGVRRSRIAKVSSDTNKILVFEVSFKKN